MYKPAMLILGGILALVVASSASAQTQITLAASSGPNGTVTFTSANQGTLTQQITVALGTCGGTTCTLDTNSIANSHFDLNAVPQAGGGSAFGAYSFTTTLAIAGQLPFLDSPSGGMFTYHDNGSFTDFTFSSGAGSVSLRLTIATVGDGSTTPRFNGTYTTNSSSDLMAGFFVPGGGSNRFDFTVDTGAGGIHLSTLFGSANGTSTSGRISSGEIVVPEPASMALFGSGLVLAGWVARRRFGRAASHRQA